MSLDPRTKLLAVSFLIVTTFLTTQNGTLAGPGGLLLITFLLTRTPFTRFLRHCLWLAWLLIFTVLAHIVGHPVSFSAGFREGLFRVAQVSVAVGWVTLLGAHTTPFSLVHGLERMARPLQRFGFPLHKLSLVTMLSLRFLPLLAREGEQLVQAYLARGIDLTSGTVFTRLKHYTLLCIPLFNTMLRRVEHIAAAMEIRGYEAGADRTSFRELRLRPADYCILGGSLLLLLLTRIR